MGVKILLEKLLREFFAKMQLDFYRRIFTAVREREGSLTAMEMFLLEVINILKTPTIGQFARFVGISHSNATYKVNCLMKKGYINRIQSEDDRRECLLGLTDKYYSYSSMIGDDVQKLIETILKNTTVSEQKAIEKTVAGMIGENKSSSRS